MNEEEEKKAMELKTKFQKEFWPEWDSVPKRRNRYGITLLGLGGTYYDYKTRENYPVIIVGTLSKVAKRKLTAELQARENSREFLFFEGAIIEIEVIGRAVAG